MHIPHHSSIIKGAEVWWDFPLFAGYIHNKAKCFKISSSEEWTFYFAREVIVAFVAYNSFAKYQSRTAKRLRNNMFNAFRGTCISFTKNANDIFHIDIYMYI